MNLDNRCDCQLSSFCKFDQSKDKKPRDCSKYKVLERTMIYGKKSEENGIQNNKRY